MPAEVVIDLTYALYSLVFAGGAFNWTLLLDPWGIFGIAGRPRDAATEQVIERLRQSPNPAARLWSIELTRGLNDFGLVISTGGSGRSILDAWSSQFVNNLVAQGVSQTRAQEIAINAMSRQAQNGAPLEPELLAPMPEGLTFNGPQSVADTFLNGVKYWNGQGFKGPALLGDAENFVLSHSTAADLTALTIGQPAGANTTLPTSTTSLGSCQPGYTYDVATELCWPIPAPTIPPPGGGTTGGGGGTTGGGGGQGGGGGTTGGGDDGNNDEIGDYGDAILADLDTVVALLQNLGQDDPNGCLCLIAAAVPGITSALTAILASLPTGGAPTTLSINLTGVTAAVEDLVAAVKALNIAAPPATGVDLTETNAQLGRAADADQAVADAINATPALPADAKAKADALVDYLVANYAFDSGAAQLAKG
jgi:hypothetical protein